MEASCLLQRTGFRIIFTVVLSSVLAKTITLVLPFRAKKPGSRIRKSMGPTIFKTIVLVCSLIQATICGIWLETSPPFLNKDSHSESSFIVIECNKGSITAYYCVLGYKDFLVLVNFIVAFWARSLPDTLNEALRLLHSAFWCFAGSGSLFFPLTTAPRGRPQWLWRSLF